MAIYIMRIIQDSVAKSQKKKHCRFAQTGALKCSHQIDNDETSDLHHALHPHCDLSRKKRNLEKGINTINLLFVQCLG